MKKNIKMNRLFLYEDDGWKEYGFKKIKDISKKLKEHYITIGEGVVINDNVHLCDGIDIGDDAKILSGSYIGDSVWIGNNTVVGFSATINYHCIIGADVFIEPNIEIPFGVSVSRGKRVTPKTKFYRVIAK